MEKFITQCFGVDISKLDFTVCLAKRTLSGENRLSKTEKFENSKQGFNQFLKWSMKLGDPGLKTLFLMEATGVYYEPLAYHLHKLKKNVCVILPNKVKHYAKSLNIKTKTDAVDSRIIAQLGVEREHLLWAPPLEIFKTLRALTRLYTDLKQEVTVFSNRNESLEFGEGTNTFILATNRRILNELEKQIERCKEEIRRTIESETWLEEKVK
ncbi:MAG: IS110 family transposase, partial [Bacteroidetes bacterium]|nr:IS110 family transposase [Bacteroidota bacterium]